VAEKKRCLGLVELTQIAHLMFIKAVSVADERGRVAFQRMKRKDVDNTKGTGKDMGWSFRGYSIAITGSHTTAGRLAIGYNSRK
jgi:hypothetical protein